MSAYAFNLERTAGPRYVATKSGIRGLAESFRKEVNPYNLRICLIAPGSVGSDMQPSSPKGRRKHRAN
ncbi:SDR family NAD(P)-dependent oxidoreductase [Sphingobacterium sp. JB170]|uniref:SDR family NAD(P)-dependent oxidoreductase n=1 Tax=Sphingobacterium sp. JB170 TaxID=1434842 RepID=UPI00358FC35B